MSAAGSHRNMSLVRSSFVAASTSRISVTPVIRRTRLPLTTTCAGKATQSMAWKRTRGMFIGSFSTRWSNSAIEPAWIVDIDAWPTEMA